MEKNCITTAVVLHSIPYMIYELSDTQDNSCVTYFFFSAVDSLNYSSTDINKNSNKTNFTISNKIMSFFSIEEPGKFFFLKNYIAPCLIHVVAKE